MPVSALPLPSGQSESARHDPPMPCRAGDVLGNAYRVGRRIGSGGMADVYEAEHLRLGLLCAAKVLRPGRQAWDTAVRRFLREARQLARLKSDYVVRVLDVSDADSPIPYFIMDLLDGQDLRALFQESGPLSSGRAVKLVRDACLGVAAAHGAGIVHRDLKPENLFVTYREDGEEVCKLLDFGVSKSSENTTTSNGALVGTMRYMAPEQVENAGAVTSRADVYSLGVILYEALAGRPPHAADSVERTLFKALNEAPAPLADVRPVSPGLEAIVLRALSRDAADRFASALELAEALRPYSDGVKQDAPQETCDVRPRPSARAVRRRRVVSLASLVLAGSTLLTGAWVAGAFVSKQPAEQRLREQQIERPLNPPDTSRQIAPPAISKPPPADSHVAEAPAISSAPSAMPARNDRRTPSKSSAPAAPGRGAVRGSPAAIVNLDARNPYVP